MIVAVEMAMFSQSIFI